jgi:hypothetical protein
MLWKGELARITVFIIMCFSWFGLGFVTFCAKLSLNCPLESTSGRYYRTKGINYQTTSDDCGWGTVLYSDYNYFCIDLWDTFGAQNKID